MEDLVQTLCYQQVEEDADEHCCIVDIDDAIHVSFEESIDHIVCIAPTDIRQRPGLPRRQQQSNKVYQMREGSQLLSSVWYLCGPSAC